MFRLDFEQRPAVRICASCNGAISQTSVCALLPGVAELHFFCADCLEHSLAQSPDQLDYDCASCAAPRSVGRVVANRNGTNQIVACKSCLERVLRQIKDHLSEANISET